MPGPEQCVEQQLLVSDALYQRFQRYLGPDLALRLVREGDVPAHRLLQECKRLRAELAAVAALLPYPLVKSQNTRAMPGQIQGTIWQGSLLVAEISGLTALAERFSVLGKQGAVEFGRQFTQLFDGLAEDIHSYSGGLLGGGLLRLHGNRLMVFFDAHVLPRHVVHAVSCAQMLQARVASYAEIATPMGSVHLGLRVGIASGRFLAAEVGDASHIELVVAGPHARQAIQAQELAAPGEVVISAATRDLLPGTPGEARRDGFHLLQYMPRLPQQRTPSYWGWESGAGNLSELRLLLTRLDVLRSCLPYGLPAGLLATKGEPEEPIDFCAVTALCIGLGELGELFDAHADDPMPAAHALNACYQPIQAIIHRYGGSVAGVSPEPGGETLIALFGAPLAHDDNSLRAVRAAVEVQAALAPHVLSGRRCIGIASGTIWAGLVGSERRRDYLTLGAVMRQALHLAAAAADGEIWLAPAVRRQVERAVQTRPVHHAQSGAEIEPLTPAIVVGLLAPDTPLPAHPLRAPLVGRDAELALLLEGAAQARAGAGQVVALIGDAGSGKTRLIEELLVRLADQAAGWPCRAYRVECQHNEQQTPYALARDLLRQMLLLWPPFTADQVQVALAARLRDEAGALLRFAPVLGDLLGLPLDETPVTTALSPEQRHERAVELIAALLHNEAHQQTLALVVDDLHWVDVSSLELLDQLAQVAPDLPLLLLLSYRPQTLPIEPWRNSAAIVELGDLTIEESMALAANLLGGPPPPALAAFLDQAQGNPFFVEELIGTLLEQHSLHRAPEGWQLLVSTETVALPYSIERVIGGRLARLNDADRAVAQAAAVIGRRFSRSMLAGLVDDPAALPQQLEALLASGLIRHAAFGYSFRHTLLRDTIYESTAYARRRELHRRAAVRLAELHGDRQESQIELLARHSLLAEEWADAFAYHLAAGRQARQRHANHEAVALFETALALVPRLNPPPYDHVLELHERLGYLYGMLGQPGDALASFEQALTLCKRGQTGASVETLMRIHRHIASIHERRADYEAAFAWLERALALGGAAASQELTRCLLLGAGIYNRQGKYAQSLEWAERGLRLAAQMGSARDQAHALKLMGGIYGHLGDGARAVELTRRSLQMYSLIQDVQGQAGAHSNLALFLFNRGFWAEARRHYEAAAVSFAAVGNVYDQAMVANNLGDALRGLGDLDGAIVQYHLAQRGWHNSHLGNGLVTMNLGAVYLQRQELDLAEQHFKHSADLFAQAGADGFLPELLRYQAELALARGKSDAALETCAASLDQARRLGARLEEGATRRTLGRARAAAGDLTAAEAELQASLALLREVDSRYEIARTLLEIADLAPCLEQPEAGQAALTEALAILRALGARLDLEHAERIAGRWDYAMAR